MLHFTKNKRSKKSDPENSLNIYSLILRWNKIYIISLSLNPNNNLPETSRNFFLKVCQRCAVSQSFESRLRFRRRIFIFTQGWVIQRYKNRCCKMKISRRPTIRFLPIHLAECNAIWARRPRIAPADSVNCRGAGSPDIGWRNEGNENEEASTTSYRFIVAAITINRLIPKAAR